MDQEPNGLQTLKAIRLENVLENSDVLDNQELKTDKSIINPINQVIEQKILLQQINENINDVQQWRQEQKEYLERKLKENKSIYKQTFYEEEEKYDEELYEIQEKIDQINQKQSQLEEKIRPQLQMEQKSDTINSEFIQEVDEKTIQKAYNTQKQKLEGILNNLMNEESKLDEITQWQKDIDSFLNKNQIIQQTQHTKIPILQEQRTNIAELQKELQDLDQFLS